MNHHIIFTEQEQNDAVNALAFFQEFFKYSGKGYRDSVVKEWQYVADDTNLTSVDKLATKIASSN
jgi:hypothetical protein